MPRRKYTSGEGCDVDKDGNVTGDAFFHAELLREGGPEERAWTREWLAGRGYSADDIDRIMGPDEVAVE
jgi:hypothetical protein